MRKAVKVIAVIATVASVVYLILGFIQLGWKVITWSFFLTTVFSMVINLILLWALNSALARIENLERDVYKLYGKQIEIEKTKKTTEDERPYRQCQNCGSIQRTNEERCPMCNTPYETTEKSKKK